MMMMMMMLLMLLPAADAVGDDDDDDDDDDVVVVVVVVVAAVAMATFIAETDVCRIGYPSLVFLLFSFFIDLFCCLLCLCDVCLHFISYELSCLKNATRVSKDWGSVPSAYRTEIAATFAICDCDPRRGPKKSLAMSGTRQCCIAILKA